MRQRANDFASDFENFKANFDAGWNNWDKDGIGDFWMNATAGAVVGTLGATMAGPYLASGTFKAGLVRTGVSAVSQMVINKQVNLVGAAADGFFIPGAGDLIGFSFEYGYSFRGNAVFSRSILGEKPVHVALRERLISTAFSTRIHGLDALTPNMNSLTRTLYQLPNQLANYGLQSQR